MIPYIYFDLKTYYQELHCVCIYMCTHKHISNGSWGHWMDWWAHQSSNLSCMCQFALKGCSPYHSNTGSEGYKVANYPVNMQTTKSNQLRVPKITLGTCSGTNEEHFPVRLYSHSSRGTEVAMTEGQWLLKR